MVRACVVLMLLAAALSACGSRGGEVLDGAASSKRSSAAATGRVERCVDRFLRQATAQGTSEEVARRYVRDTYCARFERKGWVYEDGALSIAAQTWLEEAATCATASDGMPTRTVPCEEERHAGGWRLECALLHHVRRSEVRDYVEQLRREDAVECDDGTPLHDLGVP
jgi:hypothetical protein